MLDNLFNNPTKKLANLIQLQYNFILNYRTDKSEDILLAEFVKFKQTQKEIEQISDQLNSTDKIKLDFINSQTNPQIFVALKALELWGQYGVDENSLTASIAIELLNKAEIICNMLIKDFTNFVVLFEKYNEFAFLFANEKSINLRIDLGYEYNPLAKKDLHEGYIYCSLNKIDKDIHKLKMYKVQKFATVDKVTNGELINVLPNQSIEYYDNAMKKSFEALMTNVKSDNSQIYPRK
jgi:hypothetical protein